MWRLDRRENEVLALIEEGELLWAFDVRTPAAARPSVRVLYQSVEDYLAGNRPSGTVASEEAEWQQVASLVFPDKPTIVNCELAGLLNCGRQHVMDLVHAKQFRLLPGTRFHPGRNGSPQIVTASAKEWLQKRRML
jgi:hypothetical protein